MAAVAVLVAFFAGAVIVLDRSARESSMDICERSHVDLVRAAGDGDVDAVRRELASQPVDTQDENGNTALGCAIPRARTDVVAALLTAGADPNEPTGRDGFQELPTELALNRGDLATLTALLDHGGDPDRASPAKTPLLIRAVRDKNDAAVDLLLDHRANPDTQGTRVPLLVALDAGATHAFDSLLRHGADPTGVAGRRPVIAAARVGAGAAYRQLVDRGADLMVPADGPESGTTADQALTEAAGAGSLLIVDDLLARGANPNHDSYNSPLLRSVTFRHHDTTRRLLDAGADPDLGETDDVTLSFTLATLDPDLAHRYDTTHGTTPGLGTLLTADASGATALSQLPRRQVPPLAAAVAAHDDDAIALLLARGADPNRITADTYSPLYLAAVTCTPAAARSLLAAGARRELAPPGFDPAVVACPDVRELLDP